MSSIMVITNENELGLSSSNSETGCVSFRNSVLRKGMNPSLLPSRQTGIW